MRGSLYVPACKIWDSNSVAVEDAMLMEYVMPAGK